MNTRDKKSKGMSKTAILSAKLQWAEKRIETLEADLRERGPSGFAVWKQTNAARQELQGLVWTLVNEAFSRFNKEMDNLYDPKRLSKALRDWEIEIAAERKKKKGRFE